MPISSLPQYTSPIPRTQSLTMSAGKTHKMRNRTWNTRGIAPTLSHHLHPEVWEQEFDKIPSDNALLSDLSKEALQLSLVRVALIDWPLSTFLFTQSHLQRCRPSAETTRATSSSWAGSPILTHSGSAQPTRITSPSDMHNPQKSVRHDRQKTWPQDRRKHFDPFNDVKHIGHGCEFVKNSCELADTSCASNKGVRT